MMNDDAAKLLVFFHYLEGLKRELRQLWLSDKRQDDSAEHSWRMALMVMLVAPKLTIEINIEKAIKMALVHDVVEIEARDTPLFHHFGNQDVMNDKVNREKAAMESIMSMLGDGLGQEIKDLWNDYENQETNESKLVKAVDKLESRIQFTDDPVKTYSAADMAKAPKISEYNIKVCQIDPFISELERISRIEDIEKLEIMKQTGRIAES